MSTGASTPDLPPTIPLSPNRRTPTTVQVDPRSGRPFGAAEPKIYNASNPSLPKVSNSTHSLLRHEIHMIDPFAPDIPRTTSPTPISSQFHDQRPFVHSRTTRWEVLRYLIRKTASWVLGGVIVMLLGIVLTQLIIFPKIHTCPSSAICSGSYDPNNGNSLQLLQAFISYWLKGGIMISSIGILKLSAYQAWFILMHQGNTVNNLDLNLGAIRGSVNDAFFLLFKKNNRLLSIFVFALLGIGAAISLVTGLSIEKETETRLVKFTYNATSVLPNSSAKQLNNDGQLKAIQKVIPWALDGDRSHGGALRGTLVVPDDRSIQASDALPAGPKISGRFECEGWNNYTFKPDTKNSWYIFINGTQFIATEDMSLSVSIWKVDTAVASYLWVSNTTGLIPNATATDDGGMNIALCTHWLEMKPEEPRKDGVDYLDPSTPMTSGCDGSAGSNICVADSVNNAILNWWGGLGTAFWHITCRGGVLGPVPSTTDAERYCPITQDLWRETAIMMLDGIMQTAPRSVPTMQDLHAVVEGLSRQRWWANAAIPVATLALYLIGLVYTCAQSQGDMALKELNLEEVVQAAQTDHIHGLILTGQLRKTPVRYHSDVGFVDSRSTIQMKA